MLLSSSTILFLQGSYYIVGTAAHVWAVLVQDDQAHGIRNAEGILAARGAAVQPNAKG